MSSFWPRALLTLAVGAVGGTTFHLLNLPLPWMLGAMIFSLCAAMGRLPIVSTKRIRPPLAAVIGITLGSAFSQDTLAKLPSWWSVTIATVVSSVAIALMSYLYLRRFARFDPTTAYFAGAPGGLYEMTLQGGAEGGDERLISLTHATRIFFVAFLVPLVFGATILIGPIDRSGGVSHDYGLMDIVVLLACFAGWPLAKLLRFPNPPLLGPMLFSALAHVVGLTLVAPPPLFVAIAQVVLGVTIGGNFIGARHDLLVRCLGHGLVLWLMAMVVCSVFSQAASGVTGQPFAIIMLTVLPGGMTEMSLIALALGADVVMVTTQHLLRVVLVQVFVPLAFRLRRPRRPSEPA